MPDGTSRLRLTAMASHTASELETAAHVLGEVARAIGSNPAEIGPPLEEGASELEPAIPYGESPCRTPTVHPGRTTSLADLEREAAAAELDAGRERLAARRASAGARPVDAERASGAPEHRGGRSGIGRTPRSTSSARPPCPARPSLTERAAARVLFITGTQHGAGRRTGAPRGRGDGGRGGARACA